MNMRVQAKIGALTTTVVDLTTMQLGENSTFEGN
jgi:hypothetical protein